MLPVFEQAVKDIGYVDGLQFGKIDIFLNDLADFETRGVPFIYLYPRFPKVPKFIKYSGKAPESTEDIRKWLEDESPVFKKHLEKLKKKKKESEQKKDREGKIEL